MSGSDTFAIYLHSLPAREVTFRVLDDGRHVLWITDDVQLYVRPSEDNMPAAIEGLRQLAVTAVEMAGALNRHGGTQ